MRRLLSKPRSCIGVVIGGGVSKKTVRSRSYGTICNNLRADEDGCHQFLYPVERTAHDTKLSEEVSGDRFFSTYFEALPVGTRVLLIDGWSCIAAVRNGSSPLEPGSEETGVPEEETEDSGQVRSGQFAVAWPRLVSVHQKGL